MQKITRKNKHPQRYLIIECANWLAWSKVTSFLLLENKGQCKYSFPVSVEEIMYACKQYRKGWSAFIDIKK
jgi:hypothetical protein